MWLNDTLNFCTKSKAKKKQAVGDTHTMCSALIMCKFFNGIFCTWGQHFFGV